MSTMSVSLFAMNDGLFIKSEYPNNGGSITIGNPDGSAEVCLYIPLAQWWQVRHAFPKAHDYWFAVGQNDLIRDHAKADLAALSYFNSQQEKAA